MVKQIWYIQVKGTNYTKQSRWISRELHQLKEAIPPKLHTVYFYFYNIFKWQNFRFWEINGCQELGRVGKGTVVRDGWGYKKATRHIIVISEMFSILTVVINMQTFTHTHTNASKAGEIWISPMVCYLCSVPVVILQFYRMLPMGEIGASILGISLYCFLQLHVNLGLPRWWRTCHAGDARDRGSIPGLGKSPAGGTGNPLQLFLPGEYHGQRSRVGYSPQGRRVRCDWSNLAHAHM